MDTSRAVLLKDYVVGKCFCELVQLISSPCSPTCCEKTGDDVSGRVLLSGGEVSCKGGDAPPTGVTYLCRVCASGSRAIAGAQEDSRTECAIVQRTVLHPNDSVLTSSSTT